MVYPDKIWERASRIAARRLEVDIDAAGVSANFECGAYVRFILTVDDLGIVGSANIRSNGCGYLLAAADVLSEYVTDRKITELHGLPGDELRSFVSKTLDELPEARVGCSMSAIEALRSAFSDLRSRRSRDFQGDEALICTCFSITRERIEMLIDERSAETLEQVSEMSSAGKGCGSCRMLIQEMLDERGSDSPIAR